MLDIIVPHYNEPFETGKKFFDMLSCQRGVDFSTFRVILVHDGVAKFRKQLFRDYPYEVIQYEIQHGGVSAARNYGLDMAKDRWVQFCDFDDMYATAYALRGILDHMDRDVDYMWTPFIMEGMDRPVEIDRDNATFIHGKFFRREWLNEMNLRFPEGIHYSEDSAFSTLVNELAKPHRRGKIKTSFPAYIWCNRPDSVSMNPANDAKNLTGFLDRNFYVVEEFIRRGIPHQPMVGRMYADAYWAFHRKGKSFLEHEQYFIGNAKKYLPDLADVPGQDMKRIMAAARVAFEGEEAENTETFDEWVKRITVD